METGILTSIVLIFGLSIIVLYLCEQLKIPTVVGLILTGLIAGPHGLSLIGGAQGEVETLAEIGIILLLFTIGLELSFDTLWSIRNVSIIGGSIQVILTCAATSLAAMLLGRTMQEALLIGFLVSLSSTAIMLKVLQERGEVDSPHGSISLGVLIFQDIVVVPMMMAIPFLAGASVGTGEPLEMILMKDIVILAILIVSAKWIIPEVLYQIARTKKREIFLLFIIFICIGVAWLTSLAGLSLALGALLAGLIISESEYSHQAIGSVIPFRDVFASFFFISIGMLLDIGFLVGHIVPILLVIILVVLLKVAIASLIPWFFGYPIRTIVLTGLALGQIGEFSFILSWSGLEYGLITPEFYQLFIAVTLITMAASPFVVARGPKLVDLLCRFNFFASMCGDLARGETDASRMRDHLVIVGFGLNGRNLSRAARSGGIPYVILEMNPETVRREREKGEPIVYGDATYAEVLKHAGAERARVLVVVINDPASTRRIVSVARAVNPALHIIVRTRYLQEIGALKDLGADEVIPEEFETSVEIFTRVLKKYLVPKDVIEKFTGEVRSDAYQMLRVTPRISPGLSDLSLEVPEIEVTTFRVAPGAPIAGRTLGALQVRKKYGITIAAIQGVQGIVVSPDGETPVNPDDRVIVIGPPDKITAASFLFTGAG
ncbi:MAG: cation:proton antiporter [Methanomicrobiales archaeon]|nr:cation:proton antiporter [Methanomicrobiales archaeon]